MNLKDDKIDIQSDDSAASADSGVILNDRLMSSDTKRCNIDISTSIECDNNYSSKNNNATINIENIINLAKNVSPTATATTINKGSSKKTTPSNGSTSSTSSAASSLRSTRISITSIHSDASSSVIDSDCDVDYNGGGGEDSNGNYTITKLGHQTSCLPGNVGCIPNIGGNDGLVLLEQRVDVEHDINVLAMASASTSLGCGNPQLAFTNSSDITIGQKNYYQGPVTIQQFLIESRNREADCLQGNDNPSFQNDSPNASRKPSSDQKDFKEKNSTQNHQPYKFIFNRRAVVITAIIITLTIVIGGIFATTSFLMKRSSKHQEIEDDEENRKHIPVNNTIGKDNFGGGSILRLVTRDEWLARPESESLTLLNLPVHRVIIAHTATGLCTSQASCALQTQNIQNFHMDSRNYGDIGYNFLVGGDGAVYEGRGWDKQGAHTLGFNVDSICIAFIGTFVKLTPTEGQLNAAKLIIAEGVRLKKLVDDYRLYGARQFVGTESPGNALFEIIKKWPHWSGKRYNQINIVLFFCVFLIKYVHRIINMATNVDIIIENQTDIKGPMTISLHLVEDQTPIKVILDGKTSSQSEDNSYKFKCLGKMIVITVLVIIFIILIGGIFATSNNLTNEEKIIKKSVETQNFLRIVSREEWLARPPAEEPDHLVLPVYRLIIAHTATSNCFSQVSCTSRVQTIQNFHMDSRNLNDIMFNFLIGGDGIVYEGRGWNAQGAHTKGFNEDSLCVAFIGTFSSINPSEKQLKSGQKIIDEGVRLNKLAKDYRLYGQRQLAATESPGKALYGIIQQWPNWSNVTN
ncbi:peptidoglycan-recognition protein LC-like [Eupeodes corollae]|uniref:peptidoglycan-recognition protein LC-like n=1 Tax=Eupeodes corollae TaxID=290404 RepID=UPI0024926BCC|nr:peptidoglycan-recognition protein LC-like [Eupeodes corollae]